MNIYNNGTTTLTAGDIERMQQRIAELEQKNAELAAQVEVLQQHTNAKLLSQARKEKNEALSALSLLQFTAIYTYNQGYLAGHSDTVEGVFTDIHRSDLHTHNADTVQELIGAIADESTQCLNQIKAEAGRAGFVTGYSEAQSAHFTANDTEIDLYADEYAERVAKGE
jgi:hypothetical protein